MDCEAHGAVEGGRFLLVNLAGDLREDAQRQEAERRAQQALALAQPPGERAPVALDKTQEAGREQHCEEERNAHQECAPPNSTEMRRPGRLSSTRSCAPWRSAIAFTRLRPNPTPSRARSSRWKRSKIRSCSSAGTPGPSSATQRLA